MNTTNLKLTQGLYVSRTESVNAFLASIAKYPVLSQEEQSELAIAAKGGDVDARQKLINSNLRFIYAIAKRYNVGDRVLDLVDEGIIGLDKAIDNFDSSKGFTFLSYGVWLVRREINISLLNKGSLVRRTNKAKTNYYLTKAKNSFYCENGRYPSDDEIIEIFQKDFNIKISDPKDLYDVEAVSISSRIDGDGDSTFEESAEYNEKTSTVNGYVETMEKEETNRLITAALSALKERDREIIKMAYGIGYLKEYTNQEIAEELGFTSERIRQIKKSAEEKMRAVVTQMV